MFLDEFCNDSQGWGPLNTSNNDLTPCSQSIVIIAPLCLIFIILGITHLCQIKKIKGKLTNNSNIQIQNQQNNTISIFGNICNFDLVISGLFTIVIGQGLGISIILAYVTNYKINWVIWALSWELAVWIIYTWLFYAERSFVLLNGASKAPSGLVRSFWIVQALIACKLVESACVSHWANNTQDINFEFWLQIVIAVFATIFAMRGLFLTPEHARIPTCNSPLLKNARYELTFDGINHSQQVEHKVSDTDDVTLNCYSNTQITEQHILNQCKSFIRLRKIMKNLNQLNKSITDVDIKTTINDFVYFLEYHNNDDDFEFIYNEFGGNCDIKTCNTYSRNHRNRAEEEIKSNMHMNPHDSVKHQIIDKVHCFYQHTFDVGYRLNAKERKSIYKSVDEKTDEYKMINNQIIHLNKLLNVKKQNKPHSERDIKYKTVLLNDESNINDKKYSFGFAFNYGEAGEWVLLHSIKVTAKFATLKDELTQNNISIVSMQQFMLEYEKAKAHYLSEYCKKRRQADVYDTIRYDEGIVYELSLEHLLALMIYCNFTQLQYEFTKTYRENKGLQHSNFYHMGANLKFAVNKFGDRIRKGKIKSFYHGISEKLLFPDTIGFATNGVTINCPLSTSSAMAVAMNFANGGLIVNLGAAGGPSTSCYSTAWISDFANEHEHLFVQHTHHLKINNIIDTEIGYEFTNILKALLNIETITTSMEINNPIICSEMLQLMKNIIYNQLPQSFPKFKKFNALHSYARKMCDIYFKNKTKWQTHYPRFKVRDDELLETFFCTEHKWVKIDILVALFANIESIYVAEIPLCSWILDNILYYLGQENVKFKLKTIYIEDSNINTNSKYRYTSIPLNRSSKFWKYVERFDDIGFNIACDCDGKRMIIKKKEID